MKCILAQGLRPLGCEALRFLQQCDRFRESTDSGRRIRALAQFRGARTPVPLNGTRANGDEEHARHGARQQWRANQPRHF